MSSHPPRKFPFIRLDEDLDDDGGVEGYLIESLSKIGFLAIEYICNDDDNNNTSTFHTSSSSSSSFSSETFEKIKCIMMKYRKRKILTHVYFKIPFEHV